MSMSSRSAILASLNSGIGIVERKEKAMDAVHSRSPKVGVLDSPGKGMIEKINDRFREQKIELTHIQKDAEQIYQLLTPHLSVKYNPEDN